MPSSPPSKPAAVQRIDPVALRRLMLTSSEADFILIDVRQPEEYRDRHLPGACLMPIFELEARAEELRRLQEPRKIFYSRSGARSLLAADYARVLGLGGVCDLLGGLASYRGETLPCSPGLHQLAAGGDLASFLRMARALEHGTERLYRTMRERFSGTDAEAVFRGLAEREAEHARALDDEWVAHTAGAEMAPELAAPPPQNQIEGGEGVDDVVESARRLAVFGPSTVLELALEIELRALDLYRSFAHRIESEPLRSWLLGLADQEKQHAAAVLGAITDLNASSRVWL